MTPHRKLLKHSMTHLSFLDYAKMVGARPKMSGRSAEPVPPGFVEFWLAVSSSMFEYRV